MHSKRNFPTYSHIMQESPNLRVKHVDQTDYLNSTNRSEGICGGLSTIHIITQLSCNSREFSNPFKNKTLLDKANQIQIDAERHFADRYPIGFADEFFVWELHKMNGPIKKITAKNVHLEQVENNLKKKVKKSLQDNHSRGALITATVKRNPVSGDTESFSGKHALSMTVQNYQNSVYCTAMDSNLFFIKAEGKSACDQLAKKISETLHAYDSNNDNDITKYSVTLNDGNNKLKRN